MSCQPVSAPVDLDICFRTIVFLPMFLAIKSGLDWLYVGTINKRLVIVVITAILTYVVGNAVFNEATKTPAKIETDFCEKYPDSCKID